METDWQINLTKIKDRVQYLLQSEKLADCRFLVGSSSNQSLIAGHRLLLAMASPVFECMFYGSLQEKDDPIIIPDVQPDAFESMLNYIYTDEISISSFDNACNLYYVAKKYMLPHVVEYCTNFLLANLNPKNACRAYELGQLYEEPRLKKTSMEYIATNTRDVITDPSFMNIEVPTLMTILDQDHLNIDSELDLFNCLLKLANERGILNDGDKDNETDDGSENASGVVVKKIELEPDDSSSAAVSTSSDVPDEVVEVSNSASGNAGESTANIISLMDTHRNTVDEAMLRQAVKKIRFLSMTPKQFAEGPALSKLLKQTEALAIFVKISSPTSNVCPMPDGFCQSSKRDRGESDHETLNHYFLGPTKKFYGYVKSNENCYRLGFKVNTSIRLLGVRIELYFSCQEKEILGFSASIQNMQGLEIACTSSINRGILNKSVFELTFHSPVFIDCNQNYIIKVISKHHYNIEMVSWDREMVFEGVKISILGTNPIYTNLRSPIKGIIFST